MSEPDPLKSPRAILKIGCALVALWLLHYVVLINVPYSVLLSLGIAGLFLLGIPLVMMLASATFAALCAFWLLNRSLKPGAVAAGFLLGLLAACGFAYDLYWISRGDG